MKDLFINPVRLLLMMGGRSPAVPFAQVDCDELTAFVLAVAFFLDIPAEIVTVAADPARPERFSHVYVRLLHSGGEKIPFDLTVGGYPGSEPSTVYRRRPWPVHAPIDLANCPEPDKATARTVAAMIEKARASTSHPSFQEFFRYLAGRLLEVLSGLIREEAWRRSEAVQAPPSAVASQPRGEALLANLSEENLQKLGAWIAESQAVLQREDVDVRRLLESVPVISLSVGAGALTSEWLRTVLDTVVARLDNRPFLPLGRRPEG